MKRYDIWGDGPREQKEGEWVSFEDAQAAIQKHEADAVIAITDAKNLQIAKLRDELTAANLERDALRLAKRDSFAARAMQGLCANETWELNHVPKQTAIEAVEYADALLQELAK